MRKIIKDGNEEIEEILDPVEIKKILQYSNDFKSFQKDNETINIIKTSRIIRQILTVDGKESIVEEEFNEPNSNTNLGLNVNKTVKDRVEMVEKNKNEILKQSPPKLSNKKVTDRDIKTIIKTRNIIKRKIIDDGNEIIVEEIVDEPFSDDNTVHNPINNDNNQTVEIMEINEDGPNYINDLPEEKYQTESITKIVTVKKIRKIIKRIKIVNGKEIIEEEIIEEPEQLEETMKLGREPNAEYENMVTLNKNKENENMIIPIANIKKQNLSDKNCIETLIIDSKDYDVNNLGIINRTKPHDINIPSVSVTRTKIKTKTTTVMEGNRETKESEKPKDYISDINKKLLDSLTRTEEKLLNKDTDDVTDIKNHHLKLIYLQIKASLNQ